MMTGIAIKLILFFPPKKGILFCTSFSIHLIANTKAPEKLMDLGFVPCLLIARDLSI